jgi:hypothetical protein
MNVLRVRQRAGAKWRSAPPFSGAGAFSGSLRERQGRTRRRQEKRSSCAPIATHEGRFARQAECAGASWRSGDRAPRSLWAPPGTIPVLGAHAPNAQSEWGAAGLTNSPTCGENVRRAAPAGRFHLSLADPDHAGHPASAGTERQRCTQLSRARPLGRGARSRCGRGRRPARARCPRPQGRWNRSGPGAPRGR